MLKDAGIDWARQMESSIHFQSFQVIQQGLEQAGTLDPEALNKVFHEATFRTLSGDIVHNEAGLGNTRSYPGAGTGGGTQIDWSQRTRDYATHLSQREIEGAG